MCGLKLGLQHVFLLSPVCRLPKSPASLPSVSTVQTKGMASSGPWQPLGGPVGKETV